MALSITLIQMSFYFYTSCTVWEMVYVQGHTIHTAVLQLVPCNVMVQQGAGDGVRNEVQAPGEFLTCSSVIKLLLE